MEKQRQEQKQTEENDNDSTTIGEEDSKQNHNSEPMQQSDGLQQDASPMPATADFQKILESSQLRKKWKKVWLWGKEQNINVLTPMTWKKYTNLIVNIKKIVS